MICDGREKSREEINSQMTVLFRFVSFRTVQIGDAFIEIDLQFAWIMYALYKVNMSMLVHFIWYCVRIYLEFTPCMCARVSRVRITFVEQISFKHIWLDFRSNSFHIVLPFTIVYAPNVWHTSRILCQKMTIIGVYITST